MKRNIFIKGINSIIKNQLEIMKLLDHNFSSPINAKMQNDEQWVDSDRICKFLSISIATLQKYRENKCITFSKYQGKTLYNLTDVKRKLIENSSKSTL